MAISISAKLSKPLGIAQLTGTTSPPPLPMATPMSK